jgi:hypothetical protein
VDAKVLEEMKEKKKDMFNWRMVKLKNLAKIAHPFF